jgi:hypothetical protein
MKICAGMSILKASKKYKIPYGTLYNRVHHLHTKNVGAPLRLRDETEQLIVNAVNTMTQWKVPLDGLDIRCLVKSYLDRDGAKGSPNSAVFNDSIMELLQKHCAPSTSTGKRSRGKKITPGKRITPADLTQTVAYQAIGTSRFYSAASHE